MVFDSLDFTPLVFITIFYKLATFVCLVCVCLLRKDFLILWKTDLALSLFAYAFCTVSLILWLDEFTYVHFKDAINNGTVLLFASFLRMHCMYMWLCFLSFFSNLYLHLACTVCSFVCPCSYTAPKKDYVVIYM